MEKILIVEDNESNLETMRVYCQDTFPGVGIIVTKDGNSAISELSRSKFDCNARLTLDYPEDYIFLESIRLILGNLTSRKNIYNLLKKNPNLIKINYFRNKEWKNNQNKKYN